jgi:hypothetical protein
MAKPKKMMSTPVKKKAKGPYTQKTSSTRSDAGKIRRSPGSRRC